MEFKRLFIAVLAVSMFRPAGMALANDAKVKSKLEGIIENAQKTSREAYRQLTTLLRDDQYASRSMDHVLLKARLNVFTSMLGQFKTQLEQAADMIEVADRSANEYWTVVSKEYLEDLGLLFRIARQCGKRIGFSQEDAEKFYLEFSNKTAGLLKRVLRDASANAKEGVFSTYDARTYFETSPTDPVHKQRLVFAPDAVLQQYGAALMGHPSEDSAKDFLRVEALSLLISERASLLNFMYPDERKKRELPAGTEPWVKAKWEHAEMLRQESLVREAMTLDWIEPITNEARRKLKEAYAGRAIGPDMTASMGAVFFNGIVLKYAKKLSPKQLNALISDVNLVREIKEKGLALDQAEKINEVFSSVLVKSFRAFYWRAIKASPYFFTILSDAELQSVLEETVRGVHYALISDFVFNYFFEEESCKAGPDRCLSAEERAGVYRDIASWVESQSIVLRDLPVIGFFNKTRNLERVIAVRRYALASDFVNAALAYSGSEYLLKELAKWDEDQPVPANLIPENPDSEQMLTLYADKDAPRWVVGLLTWLGKEADQAKSQAERNQIKSRLWSILNYVDGLLAIIEKGTQDRDVSAEVADADAKLRDYKPYARHSTRLRMAEIYRALGPSHAESDRVMVTMRALVRLQNMLQAVFSQSASATTQEHIGPILEDLIHGRRSGTSAVREKFAAGHAYLKKRPDLVMTVFGNAGMRKQALRGILASNGKYKEYIEATKSKIKSEYPGLFLPIPYPVRIGGVDVWENGVRPKKALTLYDVILKLAPGFCAPGEKECSPGLLTGLMGPGLASVEPIAKRSKPLAQKVSTPATLPELIAGVANEFSTDAPPEKSLIDSVKGLWAEDLKSDEFWSSGFFSRDFYGAAFHEGASPVAKMLRVTVASVLGTFLKSAEQDNFNNLNSLLQQKDSNVRFLVSSRAYASVQKMLGDEVGQLFQEIHDEEFKWDRRWKAIQDGMSAPLIGPISVGTLAHYMFLFLPVLPGGVHAFSSFYFGASAATNLAIDSVTFYRVHNDLLTVEPFTRSGLLENSLANTEELEGMRAQVEQLSSLFDPQRLGWDVIMFMGSLDGYKHWKKERDFRTQALAALGLRGSDLSKKEDRARALDILQTAYNKQLKQLEDRQQFAALEKDPVRRHLGFTGPTEEQKSAIEDLRARIADLNDHYLYAVSMVIQNYQPFSVQGAVDMAEVRQAIEMLGLHVGDIVQLIDPSGPSKIQETLRDAVLRKSDPNLLSQKPNEAQLFEMLDRALDGKLRGVEEERQKNVEAALTNGKIKGAMHDAQEKARKLIVARGVIRSYFMRRAWSKGSARDIDQQVRGNSYEEFRNEYKKHMPSEITDSTITLMHETLGLDRAAMDALPRWDLAVKMVKRAFAEREADIRANARLSYERQVRELIEKETKALGRPLTKAEVEQCIARAQKNVEKSEIRPKIIEINVALEVLLDHYEKRLGQRPDYTSQTLAKPEKKAAPKGASSKGKASSLYEILEVDPHATPEEIKKSHRKLVHQYHPDLGNQDSPAVKEAKTEMLKKINEAYEVLSDPKKRALYDLRGKTK